MLPGRAREAGPSGRRVTAAPGQPSERYGRRRLQPDDFPPRPPAPSRAPRSPTHLLTPRIAPF